MIVLEKILCCVEASAAKEAENEEMPIGSPLAEHEFVSDSYQTGDINADELKKEMDQLGMSDKMQDSSGILQILFVNFYYRASACYACRADSKSVLLSVQCWYCI